MKLLQLPARTAKATETRLRRHTGRRAASTPPAQIAEVIQSVCRHLHGDMQNLQSIALDLEGVNPFARQVYQAARTIPIGQTWTYGELARAIGRPRAARAVGQALAKNPFAIIVPCHRVLAAGGKPGGFSAHGGQATKAKLLAIEGIG